MVKIPEIHGVICATITPMTAEGQIDFDAEKRLIDHIISRGVHALMVNGSTGEGMLLSIDERKRICKSVLAYVSGRMPVIVHSGCINTNDTIDLTRHAAELGASAAAIIVPYYFTYEDKLLFQHFLTIARSVPDFPLFLYTYPGNAKNDISPQLLGNLLEEAPNIIGLKSSSTDLIRFQEWREVGGSDFILVNGVDGLMLPALALGSHGQISGNANVDPQPFCNLYKAFQENDMVLARLLQKKINKIRQALRDGANPAYFKSALKFRGIMEGYVRSPMCMLSEEELIKLKMDMISLDLM